MLELLKSFSVDIAKLVIAGIVLRELLYFQDTPGSFLIPGIAVAVGLIAMAFVTQYFINNKKNKKS